MKSNRRKLTVNLLFAMALLAGLLLGLSLVVSAAAPGSVAVGPIAGLQDDFYTASGTTGVTLVEPDGGYAYYNDGVLELNNYTYAGYGEGDDGHGASCVISASGDLTIRLVGNNTLTASDMGIFVHGSLTITGDGTLTLLGDIDTYNAVLRIEGGIIHATAAYTTIGGNASKVELTGGSVTAVCTGTAPAFGRAPDTSGMSGTLITASVAPSGTPTLDYNAANVSTYRYMRVSESRTATFHANGGTGTMNTRMAEYGVFRLPECTFTPPTGKRFKAWAVHTLNGTQVAAGERFDILSNMSFYAIWEDDTVMYYFMPGEADGSPEFDEIVKGGTLTLPDCTFAAPAGKTFAYWQIGNPAVATKYPGDEIVVDAETYIIAIWEELVYDVSFDANGGTGTMASAQGVTSPYIAPACTLTAPTGKQFKCWALGSATGTQYAVGATIALDNDTTLYAVWEDVPVTPPTPPVHTHDHGTQWMSDATNHWNECACGDKANVAAHADADTNGKCDVCDYTMSTTTPGGGNAGAGDTNTGTGDTNTDTGNTNTDTGNTNTDTGSGTTDTGSTPSASTDTTTTPDVDEKPEDKGGLGAGAIVAIALGGTAVTGCGVFALIWFAIKKKRWADLAALFKKAK